MLGCCAGILVVVVWQVGKHMAVPFADRQEAATSLLELAAELKAQTRTIEGSCN